MHQNGRARFRDATRNRSAAFRGSMVDASYARRHEEIEIELGAAASSAEIDTFHLP